MDIAKYIGLYLLKNNFCYIHGLGNLELKKRPATHDGQALQGPVYEVSLSPTGSIDDNLANFIATFEQTSISKAANALRDFSMATRAALAEGKEVEVPSLGKFISQSGVVKFISDPNLQYTPPAIPVLRTSKRLEEAPSFGIKAPSEESYSSTANINWGKVGLWGGIAVVVIIIAIFGIRSMNNGPATVTPAPDTAATAVAATPTAPVITTPDTTSQIDTSVTAQQPVATPAAPAANGGSGTRVILNTYPSRVAAERRIKTLTGNGNTVDLVAQDSSTFFVVMPIAMQPADSAKTLDSLRRMFNPKGVRILR